MFLFIKINDKKNNYKKIKKSTTKVLFLNIFAVFFKKRTFSNIFAVLFSKKNK
jgi:hypothetical protein